MANKTHHSTFFLAIAFILGAGFLRLLFADIPNISPVAAMALFGGIYLRDKKAAFILPLLVMLFSDLALEFAYMLGWREFGGIYSAMPYVYAGFLLIVLLGSFFKNQIKPLPLLGAGLLSSILFFAVSNFGVWMTGGYPANWAGLVACYVAAIPFFHLTLVGDLFFIAVFFGAFELVKARMLQPAHASH